MKCWLGVDCKCEMKITHYVSNKNITNYFRERELHFANYQFRSFWRCCCGVDYLDQHMLLEEFIDNRFVERWMSIPKTWLPFWWVIPMNYSNRISFDITKLGFDFMSLVFTSSTCHLAEGTCIQNFFHRLRSREIEQLQTSSLSPFWSTGYPNRACRTVEAWIFVQPPWEPKLKEILGFEDND